VVKKTNAVTAILMAVHRGEGFRVFLVDGLRATIYVYDPDEQVFEKMLDSATRHVCRLWGFSAKCDKCRSGCPRKHTFSVDFIARMASYWRLDRTDEDGDIFVRLDRETIEKTPGAAFVPCNFV